jgi:hypothetical protein
MELPHPKRDGNKQEVFRDVTRIQCEVINSYRHFEERLYLHLQGAVTEGWPRVTKMHGGATVQRVPRSTGNSVYNEAEETVDF